MPQPAPPLLLLTSLLLLLLLPDASAQAVDPIACLREKFTGPYWFFRVYSQYEEDGILSAIHDCVGTTTKTFVEFGVEAGKECTTRLLRESKGWTGLNMDGSNDNASINLHKEFMTAENIVGLFEKYNVSKPGLDHLTVDIDMNTFWLLQAIMAGGYRPRTVIAEVNRNFNPHQSYSVLYKPTAMWSDDWSCYFGASPLAFELMMDFYGYSAVALDRDIINMFFVHRENALGGKPGPFTYHEVVNNSLERHGGCWAAIHKDCQNRPWIQISRKVDYNNLKWSEFSPKHVLSHTQSQMKCVGSRQTVSRRHFCESGSKC